MPRIESGSPEEMPAARFANAGRRFKTGVEVPADERKWTSQLVESFKRLDSEYQHKITQIIEGMRKEQPERALEIAKQISDFFLGVSKAGEKSIDLQTFLENLENQIVNKKTDRVN